MERIGAHINCPTAIVALAATVIALAAGCTGSSEANLDATQSVPTTAATPVEDLPGEVSTFGPEQGTELAVVGLQYDDSLALVSLPGGDGAVLDELGPTEEGLVATGDNRTLPGSVWFQVDVDDQAGWVPGNSVGQLGTIDDATSEVVSALGSYPRATSMVELGSIVAQIFASTEPASRIVRSAGDGSGDLSSVTFDVIGLGDDATIGYRLHVFSDPSNSGQFTLRTVERTSICARGVAPDGLCV